MIRVAIVDDHKDIRELVGRYLGQHGCRVSAADSAPTTKPGVHRKVLTALDDPTLRAGFPKKAEDLYKYHAVILDEPRPGETAVS